VTVTMWISFVGDDVEGVSQGSCDGSLYISQVSRYCGLKMVVRHKIYVGK
jgi:hypothetical protein